MFQICTILLERSLQFFGPLNTPIQCRSSEDMIRAPKDKGGFPKNTIWLGDGMERQVHF